MNGLLHMHGPAVKKLLGWRIGDDEEKWCEKAVEALVKKLKKKSGGTGTLEDLENVLANPTENSKCVTIPKSLDGRLQISHKKGLPHVIYCRVWRWPDLSSQQELRSVPNCMYPFDSSTKTQHICINPYHYNRVPRQQTTKELFASFSISSPQPIDAASPSGANWPSCSSTSCASSPSPSTFSEDGDVPAMPRTPIRKPKAWAQVSYFELNSRVGDMYKLVNPTVIIDGFTDPSNSNDRICLGQITNVNRNTTIELTRMHIGRGVTFDNIDHDKVTITNNSETPVFVQSRNTNMQSNQPVRKVFRIPPHNSLVIFDYQTFYTLLDRSRYDAHGLNELSKMCFIRMSFVKGWGDDYPRQDVTSTPCWLEVRLNLPLAYIDEKLKHLPKSGQTEQNSVT
ncbi:unnamed protein product [Caenorhabditis bovis]|uniref:MAD homolog n=1 Tax=Caenorhabditis bovis TaxID=2654633 RepID=A0A8S1EIA4_9PELO|nr:unnamed protein product [Caenorhabditis bovis]